MTGVFTIDTRCIDDGGRARLTSAPRPAFDPAVPVHSPVLDPRHPLTVGCLGGAGDLQRLDADAAAAACDVIEIRLDLLDAETRAAAAWRKFASAPLLFTARRGSEGGAGDLDADTRAELLRGALGDAALIDLELASLGEMRGLTAEITAAGIPWIASLHDFRGVPTPARLEAAREEARAAGAAAFKAAVTPGWAVESLPALAGFVRDSDGFPTALMGMGPLAAASRVLFAQFGSVLNYGYLGETPTAPGQWSAARLRDAIRHAQILGGGDS